MPPKVGISIDVLERAEEKRAKREKQKQADAAKDIFADEEGEVDYRKKPLDAKHVRSLADLISYSIFLCFIFCVVFLNPAEINANKIVAGLKQVLNNEEVSSVDGMWDFIETVTPIVHTTAYYNGKPFVNVTEGAYQPMFVAQESMALGRVRIRQHRLQGTSCVVPESFDGKITTCNAAEGAAGVALDRGESGPYKVTGSFDCDYQTHGDGYAWYSGKTKVSYPSEGFVVTLPLGELEAANYIATLKAANWVDERTRVVFVEFSAYNANVDHFAVARYAFELLPAGLVVPSLVCDSVPLLADLRVFMGDHASTKSIALVTIEFMLYAMVLSYLTKVADVAAKYGSLGNFLADGWNVLDVINVFSFACLVVTRAIYTLHSAALKYDVNRLSDDDGHQPIDIDDMGNGTYDAYYRVRMTVEMWRVGRNLLAIGVFANFAKAFKYVRASPKLSVLSETISLSLPEIGNLTIIFLILFVGFALALRLVVGSLVPGYADFTDGCFSLMAMILGDFNLLDDMIAVNPAAVTLFFVLIMVTCNFVMLTLLLKGVDVAFQTVVDRQKDSQDRFAEELREAALLVVREAYWAVAAPIQLAKVQTNLAKRAKTGRDQARLDEKAAALAAFGDGSALSLAGKPITAGGGGAGGGGVVPAAAASSVASLAGTSLAAASSNGAEALAIGSAMAATMMGSTDGGGNAMSDMERLAMVKGRIAAGRFVGEEEVLARDVAETVAYLLHRQGVLLKRLKALAEYIDEGDVEEVLTHYLDDEDIPPDAYDPTASAGAAPSVGLANVAPQRSAVVAVQKALPKPSAAAGAVAGAAGDGAPNELL